MSLITGICGVFIGCWLNAIFLELLVRKDPGCGTLVTFAQFLFISIVGFIFTLKKNRHIPIMSYFVLVVLFSLTNILNNLAFDFNISMPLHMIFRSGSLITNMFMGVLILKRKYTFSKYLSVVLITMGVCLCTLQTSQEIASASSTDESGKSGLFWWCLGICLLIVALLISALLGIYQEMLFQKHGKHPYEALFYTHLLGLPLFLTMPSNIWEHFLLLFKSSSITLHLIPVQVPSMVYYLIGNICTQYVCISSVYHLATETSSFVLTLVITLRKFISLLFSIIYFKNSFTLVHWFGTTLVFVGTAIFTELPQQFYNTVLKHKRD